MKTENISRNDFDIGIGPEDFVQRGEERLIEFDRDHAPGRRGQMAGEAADSRPNLQYRVHRREVRRRDDFRQRALIHQKVLAEAFFRVQLIAAQQAAHVEGDQGTVEGTIHVI